MRIVIAVLASLFAISSALAEEKAELSPEERKGKVAERRKLNAEAKKLEADGEIATAIEVLEKLLVLDRRLYGPKVQTTTMMRLAILEERRGDFAKARLHQQALIPLMKEAYGPEHWATRRTIQELADLGLRERLAPAEREELRRSEADLRRASTLRKSGKAHEAIEILRRVIAIRTRLLGADHPELAQAVNSLGVAFHDLGRHEEAVRAFRRSLDLLSRSYGDECPLTAGTIHNLAALHESREQYAEAEPLYRRALAVLEKQLGEDHPEYASALNHLGGLLGKLRRFPEAEPLVRKAIAIWSRQKEDEQRENYPEGLSNLADLLLEQGRHAEAVATYGEALEACTAIHGKQHPRYAHAAKALAHRLSEAGEHARAEALYREALAIYARTFGERHEHYAETLCCLAILQSLRGRVGEAESLARRAVTLTAKALGDRHPLFANAIRALGQIYRNMGLYSKSEPLLRRALVIYRASVGRNHWQCAQTLDDLACLYRCMRRYRDATESIRMAIEILRSTLGRKHERYSRALLTFSSICLATGAKDEAEDCLREALEISRSTRGEDHSLHVSLQGDLAGLLFSRGNLEEARELSLRVLRFRESVLGDRHPGCVMPLGLLASIAWLEGDLVRSEQLIRRAVDIRRRDADSRLAFLPEREQLETLGRMRGSLHGYLSVAAARGSPSEDALDATLAWKGALYSDQAMRAAARKDEATREQVDALKSTSRRLAALQLAVPAPAERDAWRKRIAEFTATREKQERELAELSATYRKDRAARRPTASELRAALPSGVALVDLFEYARAVIVEKDGERAFEGRRSLVAFVVTREGTARVELGETGPIEAAVDAWRAALGRHATGEAGRELRRLVWEPLAAKLEGATTILVSPDAGLNRLPLAALPGTKPGTFLLDEVAVGIVPVPRLLPRLLDSRQTDDERQSLLLVGDVDYGARPGGRGSDGRVAAGKATGALPRFEKLDATRTEIAAIRDSFELRHEDGEVRTLRRAKATEEAFRTAAEKHRWLHVATHGFFAPPELESALDDTVEGSGLSRIHNLPVAGYHPGVLSGLALSGANAPPEEDGDDGILTALEVTSLDLSGVALAVLSACETGLGEVAAGEGVLGLQRAFQVAGARTTITSLWKVPDIATQLLMARFYENLWDRDMGKLEALREAQLWLMREGGKRGISLPESESAPSKRLPPFYWAGFVLSGDWR